ncbi:MAG TPA: hypothetical protein VFQ15_07835 [Jiangellaceae bacterium]|nr:hypothetical protein [Jiangellaceae bacterium]
MKWLLTVSADIDRGGVAAMLADAGGSLREDPAIPMDDDEVVFFAEGPHDLPQQLAEQDAPVLKVSPDSDVTLY